ncbi:hypothetical protein FKP32DRAFT_468886 [Trametes sanguinea]|nr:hypothetical protein FKP32DRAFT_468886 [Trametes sanguinea]
MPGLIVQHHPLSVARLRKKSQDYTQRIPPEVLGRIFLMVQDVSVGEERLNVTWVNRYWRAVALDTTRLWTRIAINRGHSLPDVDTLLARSGRRGCLDLRLSLTHLNELQAQSWLSRLWTTSSMGRVPLEGLRSLGIHVLDHSLPALDWSLPVLMGPNLVSLAIEYHGSELPPYTSWSLSLPENLPSLRELRIRGLFIAVPNTVLASLKTLEVSETSKFDWYVLLRQPHLRQHLHDMLLHCTSLNRLVLRNVSEAIFSVYHDAKAITLPALQYLEILDQPQTPSQILDELIIPDTAEVHIHTSFPAKRSQRNFRDGLLSTDLLRVGQPLPTLSQTTALSLEVGPKNIVRGWTGPSAQGDPSWSVTADLSGFPSSVRQLLTPRALGELTRIVNASLIVHLELHIPLDMHIRERDWDAFFGYFTALRYLRIGGEHTAHRILATERPLAANRRPVITPRLTQLSFCVDRVTRATLSMVGDKFEGRGTVVWFRLPERSHDSEEVLAESPEASMGSLDVRVEYGPRCSTCYTTDEPPLLSFAERLRIEREEASLVSQERFSDGERSVAHQDGSVSDEIEFAYDEHRLPALVADSLDDELDGDEGCDA